MMALFQRGLAMSPSGATYRHWRGVPSRMLSSLPGGKGVEQRKSVWKIEPPSRPRTGDIAAPRFLKGKSIEEMWNEVKREHPNCMVMFQIGDFYELHNEDAKLGSQILDIKLTGRPAKKNPGEVTAKRTPMAGIPVRALRRHLPKLSKAGVNVVVVDQVEGLSSSKDVRRSVARVVTPGTLFEDELLEQSQNNFLVAIAANSWSDSDRQSVGFAWGDVSTGELFIKSLGTRELKEHFERIAPAEVLLPKDVDDKPPKALQWLLDDDQNSSSGHSARLTFLDHKYFADDKFMTQSSSSVSLSPLERLAVNALSRYVSSTIRPEFEWAAPQRRDANNLVMDLATRQGLEVTKPSKSSTFPGSSQVSLLSQVDYTKTAMGARMLRDRLDAPILNVKEINKRLDAVEFLLKNKDRRVLIQEILRGGRDPERALQRLKVGRGSFSDLVDILGALTRARAIADEVLVPWSPEERLGDMLQECSNVLSLAKRVDPNDLVDDGLRLVEKCLETRLDLGNVKESIFDQESASIREMHDLRGLFRELKRALNFSMFLSPVDDEEGDDGTQSEGDPSAGSDHDEDTEDIENTSINREGDDDSDTLDLKGQGDDLERLLRPTYSPAYEALRNEALGLSNDRINDLQAKYQSDYDKSIRIFKSGGGMGGQNKKNSAGLYVIEAAKKAKLPSDVFRLEKSLKNKNRYVTAELDALNSDSYRSRDMLNQVQRLIKYYLVGHCVSMTTSLKSVFSQMAQLDVACSSARCAEERSLTRPIVLPSSLSQELDVKEADEDGIMVIKGARHLAVERNNVNFVKNDLLLQSGPPSPSENTKDSKRSQAKGRGDAHKSSEEASLWLITGPNMGGKSTFLRSCALIVVLAQAGCFVPCDFAKFSVVGRIFARIGASDDIARNRSTFMVEMEETAQILTQATRNSLVIVDELGRGTSPEEGFALAQASIEELVRIGSRCLFATHFHTLADLDLTTKVKRMKAEVIANQEKQMLTFTYRLKEGAAKSSEGILVAKMAGVPMRVIQRARELVNTAEHRP